MRMGPRGKALASLAGAVLLALAPAAGAQRFAFVSTRAPDAAATAYDRPWQSEVFFYRDGSELRLTSTPHASEHDPVPGPGGRHVAFVAHDHSDEEAGWDAWGWYLAVVEVLTGREVARWELPYTIGMTRPAGGFQVAWAGESVVLAQTPSASGGWEVYRFDLEAGEARSVTEGFGTVVEPSGDRFATSRFEGVFLIDVDSGAAELVFEGAGSPLGWWRGDLFVATESGLVLVDVETRAHVPVGDPALVTELRAAPGDARYAYVRLVPADGGTELVVVDPDGGEVPVWLDGWVSGVDWLGASLLVFAVEETGGDWYVQVLDLRGQGFGVASIGVDHSPRAAPPR